MDIVDPPAHPQQWWAWVCQSAHGLSCLVAFTLLVSVWTGSSVNTTDFFQRFFLGVSPGGLTFSLWGCYSLCPRYKLTELAHSFLFCSCVCFCKQRGYLCCNHGPFNCISLHKFSRRLSALSYLCSGLISALLVLSTICLFMKVSLSPDIIPSFISGLHW